LSNQIVTNWQLTTVMANYRRTTDASVGTNVVSSLLTAVAFLRFPTYYVCCDSAWLLTCKRWLRYSFGQSFSNNFHSITVANIKWVYIS